MLDFGFFFSFISYVQCALDKLLIGSYLFKNVMSVISTFNDMIVFKTLHVW